MTLVRSFEKDPAVQPHDHHGKMSTPIRYTVARSYEGVVDDASIGVGVVAGHIESFHEVHTEQGSNSVGATKEAAARHDNMLHYRV